MDALYHSTNKTIQEIQQLFQHLNSPQYDSVAIENDILMKLSYVSA